MPIEALLKELTRSMPRLETRLCEPLSAHTSLRIGGPADAMVFPKSAKELTQILSISRQMGEKPIVIGNGTNLLAPDEPLRRLVVKTQGGVSGCFAGDDGTITAESGTLLSSLASLALKNSLTGLEFAQGIPGTLGGALVMNAGAYGGEIGNLVHATVCLNEQGQINTLTGGEQDFSYRHSIYTDADKTILSCVLRLTPGNPEEISSKMEDYSLRRRASQPLELPSAGSAFKRPKTGYAAELIDRAGLKGKRVGGAQISDKHAGFIVNTGGATCADVLSLMDIVRETVYRISGISLEPEIRRMENG